MLRCLKLVLLLLTCLTASAVFDIPSTNRVTWAGNIGIPGGIPNVTTIFTNLPAGSSESTIQQWLDACPSNQAVVLDPGTYLLTNALGLRIKHHGVVLRGGGLTNPLRGATNTILISSPNGYLNFNGIIYRTGDLFTTPLSGYTKGSTNISVSSVANLHVGNIIKIYQGYDPAWQDAHGVEGGPGTNCVAQWIEVTSITTSGGNVIGFQPPLCWTYDVNLGVSLKFPFSASGNPNCLMMAGLENLTMTNTTSASSGQNSVLMQYTKNCWIKNCILQNAYGRQLELQENLRPEVRQSVFYLSAQPQGSGKNYGINFGETFSNNLPPATTTGMLIEDCVFDHIRAPILFGYASAGSVIGYSLFTNVVSETSYLNRPSINSHSAHPLMNLAEGNLGTTWNSDFLHGSSSHATLFKNLFRGRDRAECVSSIRSIEFDAWQRWNNALGNILGYPTLVAEVHALNNGTGVSLYNIQTPTITQYGNRYYVFMLGYGTEADTHPETNDVNVALTTFRHGNYDYVNNAQVWDTNYSDHVLLDSMYYASRPSWYPAGYVWPPIDPSVPKANENPALHWYLNNNGAWDGGAAINGTFPIIGPIADATIAHDTTYGPVHFYINDLESNSNLLTLSGISSDQVLVPTSNITFGGTGTNRTITIVPAAGLGGAPTITVTVTDTDNQSSNTTFVLTVTPPPANQPPTITPGDLTNQVLYLPPSGGALVLHFLVADDQTPPPELMLGATSSNTGVLLNTDMAFLPTTDAQGNSYLQIAPSPGVAGMTTVTVIATDLGGLSATNSFTLDIRQSLMAIGHNANTSGVVTSLGHIRLD